MDPITLALLLAFGIPTTAAWLRFRRHKKQLKEWREKRPESLKRRVERP